LYGTLRDVLDGAVQQSSDDTSGDTFGEVPQDFSDRLIGIYRAELTSQSD
jgi:hypothetical protein